MTFHRELVVFLEVAFEFKERAAHFESLQAKLILGPLGMLKMSSTLNEAM